LKLKLPRGIRDIDPDLYEKFTAVYDEFRELCRLYGYRLMEPATIEMFETLALKSGPDIEREIYAFEDKAGRKLGLRFDLTVGLTRYVVSNPQLPKPVKLAAFSVQWRYDEPQYGRYRSFYAWDIEVYGGEEEPSIVECVEFCDDLFGRLGLRGRVFRLSDRRLVEGLIRSIVPGVDPMPVMRAIDKLGKVGRDEVIRLIADAGAGEERAEELLDVIEKGGFDEAVEASGYEGPLFRVLDRLRALGVPAEADISIVRGLDYYDGVVFEGYSSRMPEVGALCGGGTYTRLVRVFGGGDMTACGVAGGVERLIIALEGEGVPLAGREGPRVYIAVADRALMDRAFELARELRRRGVAAAVDLTGRRLSGQLEYASKCGFDYVVILGRRELEEGRVALRDMRAYRQLEVRVEELADYIRGRA